MKKNGRLTKMGKKSHVHRYKRKDIGSLKPYIVFVCTKPLCTTYYPQSLLEGKLAECPRCDNVYVLQKHHLLLVEPHCDDCTARRSPSNV